MQAALRRPRLWPASTAMIRPHPQLITQIRHAGHNKWSQIKRAKGANDAARARQIGRATTQIISSFRAGGGQTDPSLNSYLAAALHFARSIQMPRANIDTAMKKGLATLGSGGGAAAGVEGGEEVAYEGLASEGVAVVVAAVTTNRNKTFPLVRHAFSSHGGALTPVGYLFEKRGRFVVSAGKDEGQKGMLVEAMMDLTVGIDGVLDCIEFGDDAVEVLCSPEDFLSVKRQLEAAGLDIKEMEVAALVPVGERVDLDDDKSESFAKLLNTLENVEGVHTVYHNAA